MKYKSFGEYNRDTNGHGVPGKERHYLDFRPRASLHPLAWLMGGLALGAALAYFLDPDRGRRRRSLVRDRGARLKRKVLQYSGKTGRDLANRMEGGVARLKTNLNNIGPPSEVDDETLMNRVRSAIGCSISHAKAVQVLAANGTVALSGPILEREVGALIDCVEKVPGVVRVLNELNVHKSADHIPALQGNGKQVLH